MAVLTHATPAGQRKLEQATTATSWPGEAHGLPWSGPTPPVPRIRKG